MGFNDDYCTAEKLSITQKIGILLLVIMTAIIIISIGKYKQKASLLRCTESAIATMSYEYVESYLYAPYHGGDVTTRYKTYVNYAFDIDGTTHTIRFVFPGKRIDYPNAVDVIYNPDDPTEFWYNKAVIYNTDTIEIDWQKKGKSFYE